MHPPGGPLDWRELENSRWVAWLRARFLATVLVIEPEIVAGLSKLYGILTRDVADGYYDVDELNQALGSMLEGYNLDRSQWIYRWVFDQLRYIYEPQTEARSGVMVISVELPAPPELSPPSLPELNWNPFEYARADMKRAYDEYLDLVDSTFRRAGYVSAPEKRTPEHFIWLAAYQVLGYSPTDIARAIHLPQPGLTRQRVEQGIKSISHEIGLNLRNPPHKRGVSSDEISRRLNQCKAEIDQITDQLVSKTPNNRPRDSIPKAKKRPRR